MRMVASLVSCVGVAFLVTGCGGPPTGTVDGQVTIDGKPLDKGVISFAPIDGSGGPPVTANVENGKYRLQAQTGNKRVMISAPLVTGKRKESTAPDAPMVEITEERLSEKYNVRSDLTFEVKSGGNTKDWAVESKPGRKQ
ncbi:hypothetical protein [Fimbriiglobus ruber]|uniref:Carboxypeptidase regulatory-like domain-containing protein n=1 Tax=Fimbriiglobus ruber TaxID=1908690 RepID=A0A225DVD7_9BACT|nr:hypothetical protein [Fimbriiglobus ruber]OWK45490.1 hypothetical protein FRUB_01821 [Fimbriiglobus ruber]